MTISSLSVAFDLEQRRYIDYSICRVTSENHKIEGSCNLMSRSASLYVTTVQSLLVIGIVEEYIIKWLNNFMEKSSEKILNVIEILLSLNVL